MDAAADGSARGVSLSQSSPSSSRKQWRAVSEHPVRAAGGEVQQGQEHNVVDFCSMQIDGVVGVDDGMVQHRIHNLARQREEMLQMEIELRAHLIAKSEIVEMQKSFDGQFKEQASVVARLQDQLHEREQTIHELERKMEEKERELHAVRLDNEDLLREQNKELATFQRERDNIEAERAHHRQQLHDLQEHIQDKERQLVELQEQQRVAQESLLYKDEQIRDAQGWMARVQEMDVLHSSTLQAELRERTEQYNQLWIGCQRQFAEMERLHMQAIQQLQLELAGGRGKTVTCNGESTISQSFSNEGSQIAPNSGNHVEANGGGASNGSFGGLSNGSLENSQQFVSSGIASSQSNHEANLPITPSIVGMPSYLQPGQVTTMHPYVLHQQGAGEPVGSHVNQSHAGLFQSVATVAPFQQWQNQPAVTEVPPMTSQNQHSLSQADENSSVSEPSYSYEFSINGQGLQPDYLSTHMSQRMDPNSQLPPTEDAQDFKSVERSYYVAPEAQHSLQEISSQFREALNLDTLNQASESEVHENTGNVASNEPESQNVITEQPSSSASPPLSESSVQTLHMAEASLNGASDASLSTEQSGSMSTGKITESALLDERSLLACIVRTIPPGGKIRISSTLPNRLGKMLAPLHWHDYKKRYGKLDDFVASHPELFVIEEDYIHLREGAQGIIAATAAVAKVAAAAASASPYSSFFPPVAVTPMADASRDKRISSLESKPVKTITNNTHLSEMQSHHSNGSGFNASGSLSNVKILSNSKDPLKPNGQPGYITAEYGAHYDGSLGNPQTKIANYVRTGANCVGKQQGRTTSTALSSRR